MAPSPVPDAVLEEADAGLLLDLENVHANSRNHCYNPLEYLERPVPEESWSPRMAGPAGSSPCRHHRTGRRPAAVSRLLAEVRRAQEILNAAR